MASDAVTWHVYVHKLRAWVPTEDTREKAPEEQEPTRPTLILVIRTQTGEFLSHAHGDDERGNVVYDEPTCEEVVEFLSRVAENPKVLNSSKKGDGEGTTAKPTRVAFACTATARALAGKSLEEWDSFDGCKYVNGCRDGVMAKIPSVRDVSFAPVPESVLRDVVRGQIEPQMRPSENDEVWGTQHLPGLMESIDGFTPRFGASLFGAAKAFAECGIRRKLERRRPVKIAYRLMLRDDVTMRLTCFVAFDGTFEDENFGFNVHKTLKDAQVAFEVEHGNEDVEPSLEGQTCMFSSAVETPFEDLDARDAHDWPLVAAEGEVGGVLWPLFFKIALDEESGDNLEISRPAIIELQAFELAMKAVAQLARRDEGFECAPAGENGDLTEVRKPRGPWTIKTSSFTAKGEEEEIEIEVSLPELAEMKANEYL